MKFRNLVLGAIAVLATAVSTATVSAQESKIDEIRERGTLRVAGILNEGSYFAKDPRTGEWRGFAVAMALVTHEMAFAAEVTDHVIFLDGGVIAEKGPPEQVMRNPESERLSAFLSRFNS